MPLIDRADKGDFRLFVEAVMATADLGDEIQSYCFKIAQGEHKTSNHVLWIPGAHVVAELGLQSERSGSVYRGYSSAELISVEARIQGCGATPREGYAKANWFRQNIVAAFRRVTDRRSSIRGSTWVTQQESGAAHAYNGRELVIQRFALWAPVIKEVAQTVSLTGFNHTCTLLSANPFPKPDYVGPSGSFPGPTVEKAP